MSIRKRDKYALPLKQGIDERSNLHPLHPVQFVDENTAWFLRPITYEIIDKAVLDRLDQKFIIGNKVMPIIQLDMDIAAQRFANYSQFDKTLENLNPPFLTLWRSGTKAMEGRRVSPTNRNPAIYTVAKEKANGIVYEQYITPPPRWETLTYEFTFISVFRERINEFENAMNELFKNKRILIPIDTGERFEMKIASDERGTLEKTHRGDNENQTIFNVKYILEVWGYLRNVDSVKKRENYNKVIVSIEEKSGKVLTEKSWNSEQLPPNNLT